MGRVEVRGKIGAHPLWRLNPGRGGQQNASTVGMVYEATKQKEMPMQLFLKHCNPLSSRLLQRKHLSAIVFGGVGRDGCLDILTPPGVSRSEIGH